ncbi:MAG: peptidyl-prolyl cis-trans isomerase, partial [Desulfamplus sp.]|nr:peptidyl-prolyl cis-trans isomerase [Desulfamplus sp.]
KIREEILRPKLINYSVKSKVVVTDSDVKAYYDANPELFAGKKEYFLRNILIPLESVASSSQEEQRSKAREIRAMLKNGESFSALAHKFSRAPNAGDGGELGLFDLDTLSPGIAHAVEGLEAGEFTDVVTTDQGYQIFYVERIEEQEPIPLEQVEGEISKKLYDEIVEERFP